MALARNLTKKIQRLRSKSNDLNKSSEDDDGFVSISFEQTSDIANKPSTNNNNNVENNGDNNNNLSTCSSGSSSNCTSPGEPITPSDLTVQSQRIYNNSMNSQQNYFSGISFNDNSNSNSKSPSIIEFPNNKHGHSPSNTSSIYSTNLPPPSIKPSEQQPVEVNNPDMDAKADEMAMNILEKVSADDYLREIRTGSWYIQ